MTEVNKKLSTGVTFRASMIAVKHSPCQICKEEDVIIPNNQGLSRCPRCETVFPEPVETRQEADVLITEPGFRALPSDQQEALVGRFPCLTDWLQSKQ